MPLSAELIGEVEVDSSYYSAMLGSFGSFGSYGSFTELTNECVFEKMYVNCFCDPPADTDDTTATESDWQCCLEKDTRLGAILCLLGIN